MQKSGPEERSNEPSSTGVPPRRPPRRAVAYWPVLPPLFVFLIGVGLFAAIARDNPRAQTLSWDIAQIAGYEAGARFFLGAAAIVLLSATATTICLSIVILLRRSTKFELGAHAALTLVILLAFEFSIHTADWSLYRYLGGSVFRDTVGRLWTGSESPACPNFVMAFVSISDAETCGLGYVRILVEASGLLIVLSMTLAAVTLSTLTREGRGTHIGDANSSASKWLQDARDWKALLFAVASVSIAAVIYLKSWAELPIAFFPNANTLAFNPIIVGFHETVTGLENFQAVFLISVMLAMFLPVGTVLNYQAEGQGAESAPESSGIAAGPIAIGHLAWALYALVFVSPLIVANYEVVAKYLLRSPVGAP
jgi:hypothetical protein